MSPVEIPFAVFDNNFLQVVVRLGPTLRDFHNNFHRDNCLPPNGNSIAARQSSATQMRL
jgi:hypothetical protein